MPAVNVRAVIEVLAVLAVGMWSVQMGLQVRELIAGSTKIEERAHRLSRQVESNEALMASKLAVLQSRADAVEGSLVAAKARLEDTIKRRADALSVALDKLTVRLEDAYRAWEVVRADARLVELGKGLANAEAAASRRAGELEKTLAGVRSDLTAFKEVMERDLNSTRTETRQSIEYAHRAELRLPQLQKDITATFRRMLERVRKEIISANAGGKKDEPGPSGMS